MDDYQALSVEDRAKEVAWLKGAIPLMQRRLAAARLAARRVRRKAGTK